MKKKHFFLVWDSSAKSPTGWLSGNQAQFGSFDECLDTEDIGVQYCLGRVKIHGRGGVWNRVHVESRVLISREEFWAGACVPASCSSSELGFANENWRVDFRQEFCTLKEAEGEEITGGEIGFW